MEIIIISVFFVLCKKLFEFIFFDYVRYGFFLYLKNDQENLFVLKIS